MKSPKNIVASLVITLLGGSHIFFTNSGYSALQFSPDNCIKNREWPNFNLNMHTAHGKIAV